MAAYYGTTADADAYFSRRLHSDDWENAEEDDKIKSLYQATDIIDRLNFIGDKTDADQELEFPRGGDTTVPEDIKKATYEVAIKLLKGEDIDRDLTVTRRKFGPQIETEYDPKATPVNRAAGILSTHAWRLLLPYLRDYNSVSLVRVS